MKLPDNPARITQAPQNPEQMASTDLREYRRARNAQGIAVKTPTALATATIVPSAADDNPMASRMRGKSTDVTLLSALSIAVEPVRSARFLPRRLRGN